MKCPEIYEDLALMEATSTIVYLKDESPEISDNEIFARMKDLKPKLNDTTVVLGISCAKRIQFKPEYLTQEIKEEISSWCRISDGFSDKKTSDE